MLTGQSCDQPHSIVTFTRFSLAFHMKRGQLTDADDSFVSYVDQVH